MSVVSYKNLFSVVKSIPYRKGGYKKQGEFDKFMKDVPSSNSLYVIARKGAAELVLGYDHESNKYSFLVFMNDAFWDGEFLFKDDSEVKQSFVDKLRDAWENACSVATVAVV